MGVRKEFFARRWSWGKLLLVGSWLGVAGVAFYVGRAATLPQAAAAPPQPAEMPSVPAQPLPEPPEASPDYKNRVVAYLYGTTPVTREELGEYLISRYGPKNLDLLINKRIIEDACAKKGIEVTAAEVEAALAEDLSGLHVDLKDFVSKVLKHYNKSLYEWKEDVIRPKLLMTKLVRDRVHVTDEEVQMGFDAYYGEKVQCQIIMWPKGEKERVMNRLYADLRDKPGEFDRQARQQSSPTLSARGGMIDPVGRHTLGDDNLERIVFSLQPGELSGVQETKEGVVVFKCIKHIPPDTTKRLELVRPQLEKEVLDRKIQIEIPVAFKEMREKANPTRILHGDPTEEQILKEVEDELKTGPPIAGGKKNLKPQGN